MQFTVLQGCFFVMKYYNCQNMALFGFFHRNLANKNQNKSGSENSLKSSRQIFVAKLEQNLAEGKTRIIYHSRHNFQKGIFIKSFEMKEIKAGDLVWHVSPSTGSLRCVTNF